MDWSYDYFQETLADIDRFIEEDNARIQSKKTEPEKDENGAYVDPLYGGMIAMTDDDFEQESEGRF